MSKIELEFLKSPKSFNADYARVLRHRIKTKTIQMRDELSLLESSGLSVTENCNGVTEFCNGQQNQKSANQVALINQGQNWSLRRDLDPRPLPYQGNSPPD